MQVNVAMDHFVLLAGVEPVSNRLDVTTLGTVDDDVSVQTDPRTVFRRNAHDGSSSVPCGQVGRPSSIHFCVVRTV